MKVNCPCGATVEAESEDELVEQVQAHVADHPDLVATYTREKILEITPYGVVSLDFGLSARPPCLLNHLISAQMGAKRGAKGQRV